MAWIETIDEEHAEGPLKQLYSRFKEPWGGVDNILKIHSLNVPSLDAHIAFYKTIMYGRSPLSRTRREMIAVAVSVANGCHY